MFAFQQNAKATKIWSPKVKANRTLRGAREAGLTMATNSVGPWGALFCFFGPKMPKATKSDHFVFALQFLRQQIFEEKSRFIKVYRYELSRIVVRKLA